jgi:signal peptidase I
VAVALAYWFTQWPLPHLLSSHPDFNYYLVQPLIWTGVALLAGYGWRRLAGRPPFSRLLVGIALLAGIFHVAVLVIAGVLGNFGDSPIAGRLVNYPKNLLYITTLLAGAEVARAYLFWVWRPRHERLAFLGATLAFFAVAMPAAQWTPFAGVQQAFRAVGGRWAPALALSALATFLVGFGGVGPSFAYRFALLAFEWFSPILPDLGWTALFLVGVTVPLAAAWLVRSIYQDTREGAKRAPAPVNKDEAPAHPRPRWRAWVSWGVTGALVALLVLVMTGALGIRLVVVDGISMEPAYKRGDVAIVHEGVDPASLQVNDVVEYRRGSFSVVHRIVTIEEGPEGRVFTTQGDNNDAPDDPIGAADIQGKVVFLIPELGHVNLWVTGR